MRPESHSLVKMSLGPWVKHVSRDFSA
jgi:hypothetical protein